MGFVTKFKTMPKQIIKECVIQLQNDLTNSKLSRNSNGDMISKKKADVCSTMFSSVQFILLFCSCGGAEIKEN